MPHNSPAAVRAVVLCLATVVLATFGAARAHADALLLIEARTGKVLHAENATHPWHPASLTKLMTSYVVLRAVKDGRIRLDTLLTVSRQAATQQPSKMGFPIGTKVTVDDALKMLMVKSANDMAVVLAEGVSGSVAAFSVQMNGTALRLGMTQSNFVNPNGLPDDAQVTSARDMGILAHALIHEFPEYDNYWNIPAIKFGRRVMRNYNRLIGRYPGADGMKTGFICASGYNLVASATRNGRQLIAVVLGSPSSRVRTFKAAQLLERGFSGSLLSWLTPSLGTVHGLTPVNVAPANLKDQICGGRRKRHAAADNEEEEEEPTDTGADADSPFAVMLSHLRTPETNISSLLSAPAAAAVPVVVRAIPPPRKPGQPKAKSKKRKKKARASKRRSKSSRKKRRRSRRRR